MDYDFSPNLPGTYGVSFKGKIPNSVAPFPDGFKNRVKYVLWRIITPGFMFGMRTLLFFRVIHHEGRQNYVFGRLAPGRNVEDFIQYLHRKGFYNHFIAWHDDGQLISLRKLVNFEWQYHLRLFRDGEVRGHYEYTPESHPKWHMQEVGMQ